MILVISRSASISRSPSCCVQIETGCPFSNTKGSLVLPFSLLVGHLKAPEPLCRTFLAARSLTENNSWVRPDILTASCVKPIGPLEKWNPIDVGDAPIAEPGHNCLFVSFDEDAFVFPGRQATSVQGHGVRYVQPISETLADRPSNRWSRSGVHHV
jgi:hypothetical protein